MYLYGWERSRPLSAFSSRNVGVTWWENINPSINSFPRAGCSGNCLDEQSPDKVCVSARAASGTGTQLGEVCTKGCTNLLLPPCAQQSGVAQRECFTLITGGMLSLHFPSGLTGDVEVFSVLLDVHDVLCYFLFTSITSCDSVLKPKHCMETAVSREPRNAGCNTLPQLLNRGTEHFESLMLPPLCLLGDQMLSWFSFVAPWEVFLWSLPHVQHSGDGSEHQVPSAWAPPGALSLPLSPLLDCAGKAQNTPGSFPCLS